MIQRVGILRAPAPGANPPLCRLEYEPGAPLVEASDGVSKRRNAAWAAGGEVRDDYRDAEATATTLLVRRLEQLKRELTVSLVGASDFRRFQVSALLADVDRLLDRARADLLEIGRQAYSQGADLGTAHAEEPIKAAGFSVTLPSGLDPVLVTHAFENTADLLTETMQQFRGRVASNVRRIAVAGAGFSDSMLDLARGIDAAGLDNAAYRAERIVRTELGRTFNGATFARLLELAERVPALRKIWIRTRDGRTRDTHQDAGQRYARGKGIAIAELFHVGAVRMRFPVDPLAEPPGRQAARETIMCRCNAATDFDPVALAADTEARVRLAIGGPGPTPPPPPPVVDPAPAPKPKPKTARTPKPKPAPKPFDPARVRAKLVAHFNARRDERGELWLQLDKARNGLDQVRGEMYALPVGSPERRDLLQRVRQLEDAYRAMNERASKHERDTAAQALKILSVPKADRTKYTLGFEARTRTKRDRLSRLDRRRYADALKAFESLVGLRSTGATWNGYKDGRIVVRLDYDNQRASISNLRAFGAKHQINASRLTSARTIVHELGHSLEFDDPRVLDAAMRFLARRTAGESLRKLSDITGGDYGSDELARPDKFMSPYVGKDYKGQATEVISMGIEYLHSEPERFAREDPDYFDFMLRTLRGIF